MSIFSPHQAHTWHQKPPPEWQKWTITLNLNNFGQNGQIWKVFLAIIKPARSRFWFLTIFACVVGQTVNLHSNLPWNLALLPKKGVCVITRMVEIENFFRPSSRQQNEDFSGGQLLWFWPFLTMQRAKLWAYHQFFCIFQQFQARKVKMTHFKSPKTSTGCGQ